LVDYAAFHFIHHFFNAVRADLCHQTNLFNLHGTLMGTQKATDLRGDKVPWTNCWG